MRIPIQGPAIVVANHPFGAIEGIILADILRSRRPDVKIMANHLLKCIPELRELLIFVDPFGTRDALEGNVKTIKGSYPLDTKRRHVGALPCRRSIPFMPSKN